MNFAESQGTRILRRAAAMAVLFCLSVAGCEPQLDPETYGKVIYELPDVEGAKGVYPLPELEEPGAKSPTEALEAEK